MSYAITIDYADGRPYSTLHTVKAPEITGPWLSLTKEEGRVLVLSAYGVVSVDIRERPAPWTKGKE